MDDRETILNELATGPETRRTTIGRLAAIALKLDTETPGGSSESDPSSWSEGRRTLMAWSHRHLRNRWTERDREWPESIFLAHSYGSGIIERVSALVAVELDQNRHLRLVLKNLLFYADNNAELPLAYPLAAMSDVEKGAGLTESLLESRLKAHFPLYTNDVRIVFSGVNKVPLPDPSSSDREYLEDPIVSVPLHAVTIRGAWVRRDNGGMEPGTVRIANRHLADVKDFSAMAALVRKVHLDSSKEGWNRRTDVASLYTTSGVWADSFRHHLQAQVSGTVGIWANRITVETPRDTAATGTKGGPSTGSSKQTPQAPVVYQGRAEQVVAISFPGNGFQRYQQVLRLGSAPESRVTTNVLKALVPVYGATGAEPPNLGESDVGKPGIMTEKDRVLDDPHTTVLFDPFFEGREAAPSQSGSGQLATAPPFVLAKLAVSSLRLWFANAIRDDTQRPSGVNELARALLIGARNLWLHTDIVDAFEQPAKSLPETSLPETIRVEEIQASRVGKQAGDIWQTYAFQPFPRVLGTVESHLPVRDLPPVEPTPTPQDFGGPDVFDDDDDDDGDADADTDPQDIPVTITITPPTSPPRSPEIGFDDDDDDGDEEEEEEEEKPLRRPTVPEQGPSAPDPEPVVEADADPMAAFLVPWLFPSMALIGLTGLGESDKDDALYRPKVVRVDYREDLRGYSPSKEWQRITKARVSILNHAIFDNVARRQIRTEAAPQDLFAVGFVFSSMDPRRSSTDNGGGDGTAIRYLQYPATTAYLGNLGFSVMGQPIMYRSERDAMVLGWVENSFHLGRRTPSVGVRPVLALPESNDGGDTKRYTRVQSVGSISVPSAGVLSIELFLQEPVASRSDPKYRGPKARIRQPLLLIPLGSYSMESAAGNLQSGWIRSTLNPDRVIGVIGGFSKSASGTNEEQAAQTSLQYLLVRVPVPARL